MIAKTVIVLAVTGAPLVLTEAYRVWQDVPVPESLTFAGILVFVLGSATWLLRSQGKAMVDAVTANTVGQTANTVKMTELVGELRTLVAQMDAFQRATFEKHAEYAREREKAVAEVKEAIRDAIDTRDQKRR